jgi:hypothetical protein
MPHCRDVSGINQNRFPCACGAGSGFLLRMGAELSCACRQARRWLMLDTNATGIAPRLTFS